MAQVYPRIANPYMPQGTPDKTNAPTPFYAPGEIGCAFNDQSSGGSFLRVRLDSGATSGTAVGAVAVGQLAYWKDQSAGLVTNDKNQCDVGPSGAINRVAGIFQVAVSTAAGTNDAQGNPVTYVCDLIIQKRAASVLSTGTMIVGTYAIADTTANTARVIGQATVTTAPVSQTIGVVASATVTNNLASIDVNIGFVD